MRLRNKIALITGSANGIGTACAEVFSREGATVIVSDIDDKKGQRIADKIGHNALYQHLDVRNENEWKDITSFIQEKFKFLDILINNAGIIGLNKDMGVQDPEHATLESWHKVHSVNLDGVFLGCKYAIALMKKRGGSIVNISSRSGIVGIPKAAAYASSKAAVRNHTKTVALYCAEMNYNIRCNSVHPAAILTSLWDPIFGYDEAEKKQATQNLIKDIPLKTMGTPNDVAYATLYLASEESKYVTGIELNVDGGILAGAVASPK